METVRIKTVEQLILTGWTANNYHGFNPPGQAGMFFSKDMAYLCGTIVELNTRESRYPGVIGTVDGWRITEEMIVRDATPTVKEDPSPLHEGVAGAIVSTRLEDEIHDHYQGIVESLTKERDFLRRLVTKLLDTQLGLSARTVLNANLGRSSNPGDYPRDAGDFGRVVELLKEFPELSLEKVQDLPIWKTIVPNWERIKSLSDAQPQGQTGMQGQAPRDRAIKAIIELEKLLP